MQLQLVFDTNIGVSDIQLSCTSSLFLCLFERAGMAGWHHNMSVSFLI